MTETYSIDCGCSAAIPVELFQAGSHKTCPSCGTSVKVPASTKLQALAGEVYPLLSPVHKLHAALQAGDPPFHGICHACSDHQAQYTTAYALEIMVERQIADDRYVRTMLPGLLRYVAPAANESWQVLSIPLSLCEKCQQQFRTDRLVSRVRAWGCKLIAAAVVIALFRFGSENVAAGFLVAMAAFVAAIPWFARWDPKKKISAFDKRWLVKIRWVSEVISSEEEYRVSIHHSTTA